MEHGNLRVLLQPAELLIIGGAASGTILIANPLHILKQIAGGVGGVFGGSKFTKQRYLSRHPQDGLRPAEQGTARRPDGAGRIAVEEPERVRCSPSIRSS